MPQATVKLQQTKPLSQGPAATNLKPAQQSVPVKGTAAIDSKSDSEEVVEAKGGILLPAAMLVVAAVVLGLQVWTYLS